MAGPSSGTSRNPIFLINKYTSKHSKTRFFWIQIPMAACSKQLTSSLQWPNRKTCKIYPVFIPWLGCKSRCIYCAQEIQTGQIRPANKNDLEKILADCKCDLQSRQKATIPELAFYGGTFTSLPEELWNLCIGFAEQLLTQGLISGFRCSTRPDCIGRTRLRQLKDHGCELVELGIQSFDNHTLSAAKRGYTRDICLKACSDVAAAGLRAGIQLLPGLPESSRESFLSDVNISLETGAACLRFYPCLVLAGSPLARLWQQGRFTPWTLEHTLDALAEGWLRAAKWNIPVIRMGLAPQGSLEKAVLAGPYHPALGNRIMGRALIKAVRELLKNGPKNSPWQIALPANTQGYRNGWRGELINIWRDLAPEKISYSTEQRLVINWQDLP